MIHATMIEWFLAGFFTISFYLLSLPLYLFSLFLLFPYPFSLSLSSFCFFFSYFSLFLFVQFLFLSFSLSFPLLSFLFHVYYLVCFSFYLSLRLFIFRSILSKVSNSFVYLSLSLLVNICFDSLNCFSVFLDSLFLYWFSCITFQLSLFLPLALSLVFPSLFHCWLTVFLVWICRLMLYSVYLSYSFSLTVFPFLILLYYYYTTCSCSLSQFLFCLFALGLDSIQILNVCRISFSLSLCTLHFFLF